MEDPVPHPLQVSTTRARQNLSTLIKHAQHPGSFIVLTHHRAPVAALVSMSGLRRIFNAEDIEDVIAGKEAPGGFSYVTLRGNTDREVGEAIQRLQLDRRRERELLRRQGLEEIPGGEIRGEIRVDPDPEPVRIAPPVRFWPLVWWTSVRDWVRGLVRR